MTQAATNGKIQYIEQALAKGFNAAQIANGLGITESAVSQLISTYDIKVGASSKKAAQLDDMYDDLEHKAAVALGKALAVCELDPVRLSVVLSRVNGLKRRSYGEGQGVTGGAAGQLVQLQLPQHIRQTPAVKLSSNNEIIEIEGRTIATIDRQNLTRLSATRLDNLYQEQRPPQLQSLPASALLQVTAETARQENTHEPIA